MTCEFTTTRRVEFADTDMAGIMHFSNYFRYMESIEHEFFRSLDLTVHALSASGMVGFARVSAACDYRAPLRYQDVVEIHLIVAEMGTKSISYVAEFRKSGESDGPPLAVGRWTVVCVRRQGGDPKLVSAPIPADVQAQLHTAPSTVVQKEGE